MELIIQKYNFSFEVDLVGLAFIYTRDLLKPNGNEELRTIRTKRKQLLQITY